MPLDGGDLLASMAGKGARWATVLLICVGAGLFASPALASNRSHRARSHLQVKPSVHVWFKGLFPVDRALVTVPWRGIHVAGSVRPYVPGQVVRVLVMKNGTVLRDKRLQLHRGPGGRAGHFKVRVDSPLTGHIRIDVIHAATRHMSHFIIPRKVDVLSPSAGFGSRGTFVWLIQHQLSRLHFFIPQTGVYDQGTGLALDAYHRLLGWGTSQSLDSRTVAALLDGRGTFHVRFPGHGRHAEGDLANQLLALIDGKHVYWIFPISSGKPSTPTILGDYQIYDREPGYKPDGMYYSDFFIRGYAIHGYDPAPDYPASHGCMRLPIVDAIPTFNWLALGDWVDTYY
jgi:hypothetical protein